LISQLDLVVSIDTAVAHLAGALGKPTLLALCAESDWRWFEKRADSPWHPSVKIFRQSSWGVWDDVAAAIAEELASRAAKT
jgi:ADP-heptose:LPS heptosyltransferase